MAKGGSSGGSMGNGGIGGSGIFGMFGTVVQCKADDTSLYCSLAKLINVIFMVAILGFIVYFIWTLIRGNNTNSGMTGGYISKGYPIKKLMRRKRM
jgi:hypothetical protein